MSDPIADLLTRIRNAEMAGAKKVLAPYSKEKEAILTVLKKYGYVYSFKTAKSKKGDFNDLVIDLMDNRSNKTYLTRISKPGQRIYVKHSDLKPVKSGLGIAIISTSKGIMSNVEAKKLQVGGEILCEIW